MKLFYRKLGEGKPLIILHGLLGSGDNWLPVAKILSKSYKVYMPDLRNHGHSLHHEDMNYDIMSHDLLEFMDTLNMPTATLMGHSMGGKVAMHFALNNCSRVEHLIIADTGIKPYEMNHIPYLEFINSIDLKRYKNRQELQTFLFEAFNNSRIVQHVLKNINMNSEKGLMWRVNLDAIFLHIQDILSGVTSNNIFNKPCLFIRGALSDYIMDDDMEGLKQRFPYLKIVTVEKAGHWLHVDNFKDFVCRVEKFLREE